MAGSAPAFTQAFSTQRICLLIGLLVCSTIAGPAIGSDFRCPDYVIQHAPLIWLHSEDPYMPSDLLTHIQHTSPALDGKSIPDISTLDLDNLETLNQFGDEVALTSNDDPLGYPEWIHGVTPDADGRISNATPCVVVLVEKGQQDLDAFYFYFYSFNEGMNISQVLEPFNRMVKGEKAQSGMHFGDHVGDWEHNMIRFRDGKPTGIYYSQHVDGASLSWDDSTLTKMDGRPIVYSARGSHANYPTAGEQIHNSVLVDYCNEGRRWDPILSAYFYRFDKESSTVNRLDPPAESSPTPPPSSNLTSFFYYSGRWGDTEYPMSDPRQEIVPKFGLKRIVSGPTGPRHKHLVRKGLKPDQRRKMGWMEWGVGIYMSLYPCCLRGWRRWVFMGLIIAVLSGAVIGIVIAVKKYRNRKYTRLQAEDIPLDDWALEDEALLSSSDEEDGGKSSKFAKRHGD
ncbi:vacuolar protein sorting-associated protein 62 [Colletotrichum orchidophilum]|uniref:Vacuolar protein sorting-associated protein 62 n=1 Tax=Colletotrichum orchidophilum TaxID=1209926 RepID=A0A1G4ASR1_9PEZI|nr:vacuolar protein sorting-associated protein 62 [Colletotrichum orchidophilum]OHE92133.1 vacuolar protein sorting-associated protein 62 [Colletotrichum orchidophilum]